MENKLENIFDFENANEKQRQAIETTEGKILINAGPGTGKTFTIVKRIAYLIQQKNIKPEEIFVATFTEKAAKELITRISNEMKNININNMYIGTFHSICLRIIDENIQYSNYRKNYEILDEFDQEYFIYQNIDKFQEIENLDEAFLAFCKINPLIPAEKIKGEKKYIWKTGKNQQIKDYLPQEYNWEYARTIRKITDTLREKMISHQKIINDESENIRIFAKILKTYEDLLIKNNLLDFSSIQIEAMSILLKNREILENIRQKIKYIMVDEYQDTNPIQNRLINMIGYSCQNICAVGDDDQGLYRFRGASIKNIFSFRKNATEEITLTQNYRCTEQIIQICNSWIKNPQKFLWENCRINKKIKPVRKDKNYQSTFKISAISSKEWINKIYNFIEILKKEGKITNYNQIAFLFSTLKRREVIQLQRFLEEKKINVYSPRSGQFFQRNEIQILTGILLNIFEDYKNNLLQNKYKKQIKGETESYYRNCIKKAEIFLQNTNSEEFIEEIENIKSKIREKEEKSYTSIIYRIISYSRYNATLSMKLDKSIYRQRSIRNLATFSRIIKRFEITNKVTKITNENTEKLLNEYINFLYPGKIGEYEDESEYAPKDSVSFMTIHQSKGMEFPVVFVCSLDMGPFEFYDKITDILNQIEIKYLPKDRFEQRDNVKYYDFWRKYYTAFSRAKDILILTCHQRPKNEFSLIYNDKNLPEFEEKMIDKNLKLSSVKDIKVKNSYSFTAHTNLYQTCPLKYKFFKELGFAKISTEEMFFGSIVHQNIEDINKIIQREHIITEEKIKENFEQNYKILTKKTGEKLTQEQKEKAITQVKQYYKKIKTKPIEIISAEQEINLLKENYIMTGKIDLIVKKDNQIEIIDFKTGKKPKEKTKQLEIYEKQLNLYAYMIMENTGKKVDKLTLYYTQEENPKIVYVPDKQKMKKYVEEFDQTVKKIQNKDFEKMTKDKNNCKTCEFQTYCRQREKIIQEKIKQKAEKEDTSKK